MKRFFKKLTTFPDNIPLLTGLLFVIMFVATSVFLTIYQTKEDTTESEDMIFYSICSQISPMACIPHFMKHQLPQVKKELGA